MTDTQRRTAAKQFAAELPYSQRSRWIVTYNFAEFYVYDMERPTGDPKIINWNMMIQKRGLKYLGPVTVYSHL